MKRVVTGHNEAGKSVVLFEGEPNRVSRFPNLPGLCIKELWATEPNPQVPISGADPTVTMTNFIAPLGGTRVRMEYYPPDAHLAELAAKGEIDMAQAGAEFAAAMPDLAAVIEPDFMHTTDTIDYNFVLVGELWCELDEGVEVHLKAGDCLVQCGARHAWRNKGGETCIKAAIMVGAMRR
ncbi:MAG: cupin domain-containing protein [Caldilineaceae bacterium]